jgi:hypothetical protein
MTATNCFNITYYKVSDPKFAEGIQPAWRAYWEAIKEDHGQSKGGMTVFRKSVSPKVRKLYD